ILSDSNDNILVLNGVYPTIKGQIDVPISGATDVSAPSDGSKLYSGISGYGIKVHNPPYMELEGEFTETTLYLNAAASTPDGSYIFKSHRNSLGVVRTSTIDGTSTNLTLEGVDG